MLAHLPKFDVFLWFAIAAAQLLLSGLLLWRQAGNRYPGFSVFVHFSALKTLFLMAIPSGRPWIYFWSYYACSIMACVLMAVAVGELASRVFGPRISLPAWVPRNVGWWLAAAVSSCALLAIALKPLGWNKYMVFMGGLQAALVSAIFISLIVVTFYSRRIGITWRRRHMQIATGFMLFLSVNAATIYVLGLTSRETAEVARRMGQIAYFASLAWWGCTLWVQETVPEKATREQVAELLERHGETMGASRLLTKV